jgi:RNA polymerase sigma-70 factor (ECF subfamily)
MVAARPRAQVVQLVPRNRAAPVPLLDDTEIIAAVRQGDAGGATALYHRSRAQVDRTLVRVLGRRDRDHEDFAQIALIELVQSLRAFRGECSLDTWISRVTARAVFKQMRRRMTDRRIFDPDASADDAIASSTDTGRDVAARGCARRVRRHLDAMDPMKAWTVILHDVCGHDLREIAEITECTVTAAQTRLSRGRIDLHERIERDPELAGEMTGREGQR